MKKQALENNLRLYRLEKLILDIKNNLSKKNWTFLVLVHLWLPYTSMPFQLQRIPLISECHEMKEIQDKEMALRSHYLSYNSFALSETILP